MDRLLHLPSAEAVSARPNARPRINHKVTGSGYKAVVGCEAETSTRALVTCSNLSTRVWSAGSSPPDFRNLSGHRCKAPPPRQGSWPRWGRWEVIQQTKIIRPKIVTAVWSRSPRWSGPVGGLCIFYVFWSKGASESRCCGVGGSVGRCVKSMRSSAELQF